jgi:hypothetical protein
LETVKNAHGVLERTEYAPLNDDDLKRFFVVIWNKVVIFRQCLFDRERQRTEPRIRNRALVTNKITNAEIRHFETQKEEMQHWRTQMRKAVEPYLYLMPTQPDSSSSDDESESDSR